MIATTQVAATGSLVQVEVMGGPDHGDPPVLTYRAHGELHVGQWVFVPAPEWITRVTGDERLPGRVLGSPDERTVLPDVSKLRDTMPLSASESHANGSLASEAMKTVAEWRRQAHALEDVARSINAAADALEKAMG